MQQFIYPRVEVLLLACVAVVFFLWLGWRLRKAWKNFLLSLIRRRGKLGEKRAVKLLEESGYKVIQSEVPISGTIYIDEEPSDFNVRADFLVERDGRKYIAEVKTGSAAQAINVATRRQLFEYATLVKTDRILLVDATNGTVKTISFTN